MYKRKRATSTGSIRGKTKKSKKSIATKRRSAKASTSRQFVTDQYDTRVDYVAVRKQTAAKVIGAQKFKSKVMKALQTQVPTITKLYTTTSISVTNTGLTDQSFVVFHMRPWDCQAAVPGSGTLYNEPAQNDLQDIGAELSAGMAVGSTDLFSPNYTLKSSIMEVYVEAVGTMDCVFDIYEIVYQKKEGSPINGYANFTATLGALTGAQTNASGQLSLGNRGVTPFDLTFLLRDIGIKVVKKSTNFVQTGSGGFTYIVKDFRKQNIDYAQTNNTLDNKYCIQGWTKSILIVCKPLVNDSSAVAGFRATRDVHYRVQPETNIYAAKEYTGQN